MGIMDVLLELNEIDEPAASPEGMENPAPEPDELENSPLETFRELPPQPEPESVPESETEPEPVRKPKSALRPEWLLGLCALLAAALLGALLMQAWPRITAEPQEEDPEVLLHQQVTDPVELEPAADLVAELVETPEETAPPTIPPDPNPYDRYDFQYDRHNYLLLQNIESWAGVDVSAYQGQIDWEKVQRSGIKFAIIRLGYRGYESGKLVEDKYARENLENARAAGLKIGAYFFSQALTIQETQEEMDFIQEILGDTWLDMPLVLDWEIPAANARTAHMDSRTLTDIQRHFCANMQARGYQPMVYFNWYQSEHLYILSDLEDYPFWLALYDDRMTYPWDIEMWQYTDKGRVPGIQGNVDLNVYMPY